MDIITELVKNLNLVREKKPLVHSITNFVVMNETANALLALGALPIMAHAPEEVEEIAAASDAVVLNIGTLTQAWAEAMILAGKAANKAGKPVIFDPVGAGFTKLRTHYSKKILSEVKVDIVRANAAEAASLADIKSKSSGVESIEIAATSKDIAKKFYDIYKTCIAITGPKDIVYDGKRMAEIDNGDVMLTKIIGAGCTSNVIVAAFAAVNKDLFSAATNALATYSIAGEMAAAISGPKPGTFSVELFNALSAINEKDIEKRVKVELI